MNGAIIVVIIIMVGVLYFMGRKSPSASAHAADVALWERDRAELILVRDGYMGIVIAHSGRLSVAARNDELRRIAAMKFPEKPEPAAKGK